MDPMKTPLWCWPRHWPHWGGSCYLSPCSGCLWVGQPCTVSVDVACYLLLPDIALNGDSKSDRRFNLQSLCYDVGFSGSTVVKNLPANAGDAGSISGLERFPGRGNGNSSQYSCLKNSMDRGVWWATVHGLAKKVRHDWATEHIYTHTQGLRLQSGW